MNAIIRIGGKQHMVSEGSVLDVNKIDGKPDDVITITEVLMLTDGTHATIGTPLVNGASVKAMIVSQGKGEKLSVRRYKSKVRHRRAIGFRSKITTIRVTSISA